MQDLGKMINQTFSFEPGDHLTYNSALYIPLVHNRHYVVHREYFVYCFETREGKYCKSPLEVTHYLIDEYYKNEKDARMKIKFNQKPL